MFLFLEMSRECGGIGSRELLSKKENIFYILLSFLFSAYSLLLNHFELRAMSGFSPNLPLF